MSFQPKQSNQSSEEETTFQVYAVWLTELFQFCVYL